MAGEIRQTTAIKQNAEMMGPESAFWNRRDEKASIKDAASLPSLVTVFEDSTSKTLRQGTVMVEDAYKTFDNAFKKMVAREIEVESLVRTHISKMKDKAGQIQDALGKIEKLTGPDFETKLSRLERFASAIETLDRLNRTGKLSEVAVSLGKLA